MDFTISSSCQRMSSSVKVSGCGITCRVSGLRSCHVGAVLQVWSTPGGHILLKECMWWTQGEEVWEKEEEGRRGRDSKREDKGDDCLGQVISTVITNVVYSL